MFPLCLRDVCPQLKAILLTFCDSVQTQNCLWVFCLFMCQPCDRLETWGFPEHATDKMFLSLSFRCMLGYAPATPLSANRNKLTAVMDDGRIIADQDHVTWRQTEEITALYMLAHTQTHTRVSAQYLSVWEFLRNGRHCDCKHVFGKNRNYEQAQLHATWVLSCVPGGNKKCL